MLKSKILDFLSTKNPFTNRLPLISVTADKITKQHCTYQIACLITLVDGVQTSIIIDISPCGLSHKGDVLVQKLKCSLENFNVNMDEQLNGMAFDGQYFVMGVDKKLTQRCKGAKDNDFFIPMWDLAY